MGLHLLAVPYAPGPQDEVGRSVDHPDHGVEEELEQVQRTADPERHLLGFLDGEVLGRLLPEDEVGVGYGREAENDGDDGDYPLVRDSYGLPHGTDEVRDSRLTDPPERPGSYRNPHLTNREIAVEVAQRLAYDRGPRTAFLF